MQAPVSLSPLCILIAHYGMATQGGPEQTSWPLVRQGNAVLGV